MYLHHADRVERREVGDEAVTGSKAVIGLQLEMISFGPPLSDVLYSDLCLKVRFPPFFPLLVKVGYILCDINYMSTESVVCPHPYSSIEEVRGQD